MEMGVSVAEGSPKIDVTTQEIFESRNVFDSSTVPDDLRENLQTWLDSAESLTEKMRRINAMQLALFDASPVDHPVARVMWIPLAQVQANDWNPNSVAHQEMKLLHTSISEDGYTMPVVAMWDDELNKAVIVDGFHRYTTMSVYKDIYDTTQGFLPVALIDKPIADRIASTVRHNRARGKHSVAGMGTLVFNMLREGETDETICNKLGLEAEELARLKHITGYSKLYADIDYSPLVLTKTQVEEKALYKKEHPEEEVPPW